MKREDNGDTYLTIIWTGLNIPTLNGRPVFASGSEYKVTISPTRLIINGYEFIRS